LIGCSPRGPIRGGIIAEGARARLRSGVCGHIPHCGLFFFVSVFYDNLLARAAAALCSMAVCGNRNKVLPFLPASRTRRATHPSKWDFASIPRLLLHVLSSAISLLTMDRTYARTPASASVGWRIRSQKLINGGGLGSQIQLSENLKA